MNIVLMTGHDYDAPRKTGFYYWAEILAEKGHQVDWITTGISALTRMQGKTNIPPPYNQWIEKKDKIRKFVVCPLLHPVNLRSPYINRLSAPFFCWHARHTARRLAKGIHHPDIVILEPGYGLLLVPALAQFFPKTRFIYTVSDRLDTLKAHPAIVAAEQEALPFFHRIRVPAEAMLDDYPAPLPSVFIPQGLSKADFDFETDNPYSSSKNAVSIGDMLFDGDAVSLLAERFPDWTFHLFGRNTRITAIKPNIIFYGERALTDIIPYLHHADVALAPYRQEAGNDYLAQSSLKMLQYTYCRLPVAAPVFAAGNRPHVAPYRPGDAQTIIRAFETAIKTDRISIERDGIYDWNEVIDRMLSEGKDAL